jgi:predicted peptidase
VKTIAYTDMADIFKGQQFQAIRTRNRNTVAKPHVDMLLRGNTQLHQLRARRGWTITSVLVNTLRYNPVIQEIETEIDGDQLHYTLYAVDSYIVAEFTAKRSTGNDVAAFPFELIILDNGEFYIDAFDRRNR